MGKHKVSIALHFICSIYDIIMHFLHIFSPFLYIKLIKCIFHNQWFPFTSMIQYVQLGHKPHGPKTERRQDIDPPADTM